MSVVIIAWGEEGNPAKPVGIVPSSEANPVDWAKTWCQWQLNQQAQAVEPLLEWKHFLSRGTGPMTSHYVAKPERFPKDTYEVWCVGELT